MLLWRTPSPSLPCGLPALRLGTGPPPPGSAGEGQGSRGSAEREAPAETSRPISKGKGKLYFPFICIYKQEDIHFFFHNQKKRLLQN